MYTLISFAAIGLFGTGAAAGIIGVVVVAIRREEKNLTLTSAATDHVTRAGRWLNGVGVRMPRRGAPDQGTTLCHPASERARGPGTNSPGTRVAPPRRKRRRGITLVWSGGFH